MEPMATRRGRAPLRIWRRTRGPRIPLLPWLSSTDLLAPEAIQHACNLICTWAREEQAQVARGGEGAIRSSRQSRPRLPIWRHWSRLGRPVRVLCDR